MTSLTPFFLKLQDIYRVKANEDFKKMQSLVHKITDKITDEMIKTFCENSLTLEWIEFRDLAVENENPLVIESYENDVYKWCLAMKGFQMFENRNGRKANGKDVEDLEKITNEEIVKKKFPNILPIEKEIIQEMFNLIFCLNPKNLQDKI